MYGMDKLIKEKTGIDTYVSDKALEAVALGAGMSVDIAARKKKHRKQRKENDKYT